MAWLRSAIVSTAIAAAAIGALSGCGGDETTQTRDGLIGIWLGQGQPGDARNIAYLIDFKNDGTLTSAYREYAGCTITQAHTETGTWSVKGNVQEILTKIVDGREANFGNVYVIERLTATEHDAKMQNEDYVAKVKRVSAFEFPACASGN